MGNSQSTSRSPTSSGPTTAGAGPGSAGPGSAGPAAAGGDRRQDRLGNSEVAARGPAAGLSEAERDRLRTVAEILRFEDQHGTLAMIRRYNAVSGEIPGRNVWVRTTDGVMADLCWTFDVAFAAAGVQGSVGAILGIFGRPGELLSAILGQSTAGLAYMGGRFIGASVEGVSSGKAQTFLNYLKGSLNEDNIGGANLALQLAWGNAFGGSARTLRSLVAQSELQAIQTAGL